MFFGPLSPGKGSVLGRVVVVVFTAVDVFTAVVVGGRIVVLLDAIVFTITVTGINCCLHAFLFVLLLAFLLVLLLAFLLVLLLSLLSVLLLVLVGV